MKKLITLAAALAFFAGPASAIFFDWGKIENLVPQGATVVVSSKPGESARITDHDDTNRWQAVAKANESANDWVLIDLSESKNFTDIEIRWEASHPSAYQVYVTNEAPTYTATESGTETFNVIDADWLAANSPTYTSTIAGEGGANDYLTNEEGIDGRYILIYCTEYNNNAKSWGSSIFEVKVAKITDRSILELPVPTTVPVPTHDAAQNNVISLMSAKYTAAANHGMQEWGSGSHFENVTIDGAPVMKVSSFNYVGWDAFTLDVTACNMMHVDFFAANAGGFGFTPISPGKEKPWIASEVKVGEWNSYDVPLTHWDNVDFTNVFQIKFDQGNRNQEGYVANVYFYHDDSQADLPSYEYGNKWYGSATADCTKSDVTYTITADYVFTAEQDGLAMEVVFDGDEAISPVEYKVHIVKDGGAEWVDLTNQNGVWVGKATDLTYILGETVNEIEIYLPYTGGLWHPFVRDYKFGASNEAPTKEPKLSLSAKVDEVGYDTAVISYTAKASNFGEGTWKVMLGDVEISESPYTITGLDELTSYTYTIKAVGEVDGQTIESAPVELAFKTKSSTAVAKTWYSIVDGEIKNAYLIGESTDKRRNIPISIESEVTYNTDGTVTVTSTPHLSGEVVGLVPKVTVSSGDFKSENKDMAVANGKWSNTTETVYPESHGIGWLYYRLAYDGGETVIDVPGYTTGIENDKPAYGEPAKLDFNLGKTGFAINESVQLEAVARDGAGHYLFGTPVEFAVSGPAFSLNGVQLTASDKGKATVTATCGDLSAVKEVICHSSAEAARIQHTAVTGHANADPAFDGNEGTQIEWNCAETEEHNLTIDLGKKMNIEVITLVWEGASATHYTVRLHNNTPAAGAPVRRAPEAKDGALYTIENGAGGAGVTVRTDLYQDDLAPVAARYVELNTTKAYNAGWGIKLKEMYINGTEASDTSDIMEAAVDTDAPVEVYNLAGVKVAESTTSLPAGIYIVRQGTATSKTVIR